MTKPVGATGIEFLLAPDPGREPEPVDAPRLAGAAAVQTPAQQIVGGWHDGRVLRYHGRCLLCGWPLWGFDDGHNDPRGPLGPFSAGFSLTAHDYDRVGPTVGLCPDCANHGDGYRHALHHAYQHWTAVPALSA
ncbi:hypothetical protein [Paractinoplanes rishiriensis]|nr:hypothetical protein [Actinoplanes rishiriensis]